MNPNPFMQMLEEKEETPMTDEQRAGVAGTLPERFALLSVQHSFEPGQLVQWKPCMSHKKTSGPFIVTEVLAAPIFDTEKDSGSCYFREPLDLKVGMLDPKSGDFIEYHLDSRRLEPYTGPTPDTI